jgi:hypothetical protein
LQPDGNLQIDWWIPLVAYSALAVGTVWGGWKIIETMGLRITTLRASSALVANIGAVTAIFGATGMGIPSRPPTPPHLRSLAPESPPARASISESW